MQLTWTTILLLTSMVAAAPYIDEGIVGGEPVGFNDMYPFMAALQNRPISRKSQYCGGSFIAPNLVLTAAR